ncbi:hypothetical protein Q5752_004835 [Cryptotrichosporon argae]
MSAVPRQTARHAQIGSSRLVSTSALALARAAPRQPRASASASAAPDSLSLAEAIRLLRALEISNPSSAFSLTLSTRQPKSALPLRGRIALPSDPRRVPESILVLADLSSPADAESARLAREAGANVVGGAELFPAILSGELGPSKVLCTPAVLPDVQKKLARYLGPKGLMPVAKRGTVGEGQDLAAKVREAGGTLEWRADKLGVVRSPVARMSFAPPSIEENVRAFITAVKEGSSAAATGSDVPVSRTRKTSTITSARLETTHGPSVELTDVL